jgi:hypothetical protein
LDAFQCVAGQLLVELVIEVRVALDANAAENEILTIESPERLRDDVFAVELAFV